MIDSNRLLIEDLSHFGVKGMHWGVVKQDTSKNLSSRRQKKVNNLSSKILMSNAHIKELNTELNSLPNSFKPNIVYKKYELMKDLDNQSYRNQIMRRDIEAIRNGKLTSNQKKLLIGGLVVVAVGGVVTYGALKDSGQLNSLTLRGKSFLNGEEFNFVKNQAFSKNLNPDELLKDVVKGLNPKYNTPGGQMNCRRVTMAYELRRRGYDVVATTSPFGTGQSESGLINALTKGEKNKIASSSLSKMVLTGADGIRTKIAGDTRINPARTFSVKNLSNIDHPMSSSLLENFKTMPERARGEIVFNFKQFGHSMSWEIIGGKPYVFDGQKAVRYDMADPSGFAKLIGKWGTPVAAEATRLDDLDLDVSFLSRWATNSK